MSPRLTWAWAGVPAAAVVGAVALNPMIATANSSAPQSSGGVTAAQGASGTTTAQARQTRRPRHPSRHRQSQSTAAPSAPTATATASPTATVGATVPAVQPTSTVAEPTSAASQSVSPAATVSSDNPLVTAGGLYHPYPWTMKGYATALREQGRAKEAASVEAMAAQQTSRWFTGRENDSESLEQIVRGGLKDEGAEAGDRMPTAVLYNIPHRDCGLYAAGGASDAAAYRSWVDTMSRTIGQSKVAVVVEPDALHVTNCLSQAQQDERWGLINYATRTLKANNPNAVTYISTSSTWVDKPLMASRLKEAGIANTRGFALNVADFQTTAANITYGADLTKVLGGDYHYVIDTSRNGSGPVATTGEGAWCNPPGRTTGEQPTTTTGHAGVDAYLWIKDQTSDGACTNSNPVDPAEFTADIATRSGY